MTEDTVFVECDTPIACQISCNPFDSRDCIAAGYQTGVAALHRSHPIGERIAQPCDQLK